MLPTLIRHRWALEPAVAVVVLAVWTLFALPLGSDGFAVVIALCLGIALCRFSPAVGLVFAWVAAVVETLGVSTLPLADGWPAYLGAIVLLFGITAHGGPVVRWVAFGSAIAIGAGVGLRVDRADVPFLPGSIGGLLGAGAAALRLGLVTSMVIVGLLAGWLAGYILTRQRSRDVHDSGSFLVWFLSGGWSGPRAAAVGPADDGPRIVRGLSRGQLGLDAAVACGYLVLCAFTAPGTTRLSLVAIAFYAVAVALRRLSPVIALGVAWIGAFAHMLTGDAADVADIAVLLVLYATAAWGDRITRWAGLASAVLGSVVGALYLTGQSAGSATSQGTLVQAVELLSVHFGLALGFCMLILVLAWVLGLLVRTGSAARQSRRALAASETAQQRVRQEAFAEQERTRIARDMHDVVAHSLAVVIAQADGARYARETDPEAVDDALTAIATTARSALSDVRGILAELRHAGGDAPQPTIDDIEPLVVGMRAAGLPVTLAREGTIPSLGAAQNLAAYRIAQEALTNALRHGDPQGGAAMRIVGDERGIIVSIANSCRDDTDTGGTATGHGIAGMRERAALAGGALHVRSADSRFEVIATLPSVNGRGDTT